MRALIAHLRRCVFVALLALVECGGSTGREPNGNAGGTGSASNVAGAADEGVSGAGKSSSSAGASDEGVARAGSGGGQAGDGASAGRNAGERGPLSEAVQACGDYLAFWKQRQSQREPGEPIPPEGASAAYFDCFRAQESACAIPADDCQAAKACVDRHCLCTRDEPVASRCSASEYPEDLCACIETCTGARTSCASRWRDYLTCTVSACAAACE